MSSLELTGALIAAPPPIREEEIDSSGSEHPAHEELFRPVSPPSTPTGSIHSGEESPSREAKRALPSDFTAFFQDSGDSFPSHQIEELEDGNPTAQLLEPAVGMLLRTIRGFRTVNTEKTLIHQGYRTQSCAPTCAAMVIKDHTKIDLTAEVQLFEHEGLGSTDCRAIENLFNTHRIEYKAKKMTGISELKVPAIINGNFISESGERNAHWIILDEVTSNGTCTIRDPEKGLAASGHIGQINDALKGTGTTSDPEAYNVYEFNHPEKPKKACPCIIL